MPYDGYVFPKKMNEEKMELEKCTSLLSLEKNALLENHRKMLMILIFSSKNMKYFYVHI